MTSLSFGEQNALKNSYEEPLQGEMLIRGIAACVSIFLFQLSFTWLSWFFLYSEVSRFSAGPLQFSTAFRGEVSCLFGRLWICLCPMQGALQRLPTAGHCSQEMGIMLVGSMWHSSFSGQEQLSPWLLLTLVPFLAKSHGDSSQPCLSDTADLL